MRILFAENDQKIANLVAKNLKKEGLVVDIALSQQQALDLLESNSAYDALILNPKLPYPTAYPLLKLLKSTAPGLPVMALAAEDDKEERVSGLKAGFDDYLAKPFSYQELAARLRVLLRSQTRQARQTIKIGPLKIIPQSQEVFIDYLPIKLTLNEFRTLLYLAQQKGRAVSAKELLKEAWDNNDQDGAAKVFTTVSRLRKKISNRQYKIINTSKNGYIIAS